MDMVKEKSWEEFRESGMLWWINMILHTFGWGIVYEMEGGRVERVYPARVKYRGFKEGHNSEGYRKVSVYLRENIKELAEEAEQ